MYKLLKQCNNDAHVRRYQLVKGNAVGGAYLHEVVGDGSLTAPKQK